jgi:hypothetical protein
MSEAIKIVEGMKRPLGAWMPQWFSRGGAPRAAVLWLENKHRNALLDEVILELRRREVGTDGDMIAEQQTGITGPYFPPGVESMRSSP